MGKRVLLITLTSLAICFFLSFIIRQIPLDPGYFKRIDVKKAAAETDRVYQNSPEIFVRDSTATALLHENTVGKMISETKDLTKDFLTLIVAVLVATITFAEKIMSYKEASVWPKAWMTSAWITFILCIFFLGLGLSFLMLAERDALVFLGKTRFEKSHDFANIYKEPEFFDSTCKSAYWLIASALLFCCGLAEVIITAISANSGATNATPPQ